MEGSFWKQDFANGVKGIDFGCSGFVMVNPEPIPIEGLEVETDSSPFSMAQNSELNGIVLLPIAASLTVCYFSFPIFIDLPPWKLTIHMLLRKTRKAVVW